MGMNCETYIGPFVEAPRGTAITDRESDILSVCDCGEDYVNVTILIPNTRINCIEPIDGMEYGGYLDFGQIEWVHDVVLLGAYLQTKNIFVKERGWKICYGVVRRWS